MVRAYLNQEHFRENETTRWLQNFSTLHSAHILASVNKVIQGKIHGQTPPSIEEVPLPEEEIWNFNLGDRVKIKYSGENLESIQRRTIDFDGASLTALGHEGIVATMLSTYSNIISVYFAEIGKLIQLYPGVLEKLEYDKQSVDDARWRFGDYVTTVKNEEVFEYLQRLATNERLPKEYIGAKGRVIIGMKDISWVEFDGVSSFPINNFALMTCSSQTPLQKEEVLHPRGFKIGDKVKVTSNLPKFIRTQREGRIRWDPKMTTLGGKEVTIVCIREKEGLTIQEKHGHPWSVNHEVVQALGEPEIKTTTEKLPDEMKFLPGDIAEMQFRENLVKSHLRSELHESLPIRGKVISLWNEAMATIQIGPKIYKDTCFFLLKKVGSAESESFKLILEQEQSLKIGDKVHLDAGPPNFVDTILDEIGASPEVRMALTESAKIVSMQHGLTAVIEYSDGSRYQIDKKYLTIPGKYMYNNNQENEPLEPDIIKKIQEMVSEGIKSQEGEKKTRAPNARLQHMKMGNPPYMELKISNGTWESILQWLQENSGWAITEICKGLLLINGIDGYQGKVKLGISFVGDKDEIRQHDSLFETRCKTEVKARPTPQQPAGDIVRRPDVNSLKDFRFMRLYDPALGRDLYLPYVLHGPPRQPAQISQTQENQQQVQGNLAQAWDGDARNVINIIGSTIGHFTGNEQTSTNNNIGQMIGMNQDNEAQFPD